MSKFGLINCLIHPVSQLKEFENQCDRLGDVPVKTWLMLTAIAFVGSALYGGSLSFVIQLWRFGSSALMLTLSAALAWCIFGPILVLVTRKNALALAHACLVTIAYGEAILAVGTCLNLIFATGHGCKFLNPVTLNIICVALSNIVMAVAVSTQLAALMVPHWKTLLAWMLTLNGSGFLFFLVIREILEG